MACRAYNKIKNAVVNKLILTNAESVVSNLSCKPGMCTVSAFCIPRFLHFPPDLGSLQANHTCAGVIWAVRS